MSLPFTKTEINRMHKRRRKSFHALDELERKLIYLEEIGHIIENFTDQNIPLYLYTGIAVHTKNVRIKNGGFSKKPPDVSKRYEIMLAWT